MLPFEIIVLALAALGLVWFACSCVAKDWREGRLDRQRARNDKRRKAWAKAENKRRNDAHKAQERMYAQWAKQDAKFNR